MTLSCIIVDDEPLAVKLLESFVSRTPDLTLLASFTDSVEAINAVKEQKPNLLFLDIQHPDARSQRYGTRPHDTFGDTCHLHHRLQGICL